MTINNKKLKLIILAAFLHFELSNDKLYIGNHRHIEPLFRRNYCYTKILIFSFEHSKSESLSYVEYKMDSQNHRLNANVDSVGGALSQCKKTR